MSSDSPFRVEVLPFPLRRYWRISVQEKVDTDIPKIGEEGYHQKWVEFTATTVHQPRWWEWLWGDTLAKRKKQALDWAEAVIKVRGRESAQ